jgi:ubiquinone/menaquinone biosynthesis C-methylase UbiE
MKKLPSSTSWEPVQKWYKETVGSEGHYYHRHVILPNLLKMLDLPASHSPSILDLACGNGVLAHHIPKECPYTGVDLSPSLIKAANKSDRNPHHQYVVADITSPLPLDKRNFSHAVILLALQNIEHPGRVFANVATHLMKNGQLILVLNHPCFRIPRQSSWQVDAKQNIQYRRIDRYTSAMKIPIHSTPSKGKMSPSTWSFHYPLHAYSRWLFEAGFAIELIEEWHSDKASQGKAAKMENRARTEIPLFLAIRARLSLRTISHAYTG